MIHALAKLDITDPQALGKYREAAGAALAKHGGTVVTGSGENTVLEGASKVPDMTALLGFPDKAAALAWIADPDYSDVHDLRRSAGTSDILLLG